MSFSTFAHWENISLGIDALFLKKKCECNMIIWKLMLQNMELQELGVWNIQVTTVKDKTIWWWPAGVSCWKGLLITLISHVVTASTSEGSTMPPVEKQNSTNKTQTKNRIITVPHC